MSGRALVLGGGGVAGIAWEAGLVVGLREAGADLAAADLIVGTSAGSVVGAHLAQGADLTAAVDRVAERDAAAPPERAAADMTAVMNAFAILFDASIEPREARRRVGELALSAPGTAALAPRLAELGETLASPAWPDRALKITAVDAADGAFTVWDRDGAATLPQAVMASCCVPCVFPPQEIAGRRYVDGGVRSATNADLAAGADRVVVLEPLAHLMPRTGLERELAALGSAEVAAVAPDAASVEVFGLDFLSPSLWRPAYAAGLAQAAAAAPEIRKVWNG
ncbi:patatin-like phospholipase family protein [Actinomadura parmotrematis]|uniref:Patatin-like phospholipase family protein n=1 Tax=Actinomadura parmotrematis TaxID=2864039 RepID=A0ABS7FU55_9ACTN|nr:patatin-like phospholipase family protein [Actinomadura parmotrematis]MBW8483068.1 patatin-like phospholipase family protein [Actinomadura parmotrematis]